MDPRIKKWADVIVDWCWELKEKEAALIFATSTSEDLVLALYEKILLRGGYPETRIFLPGQDYLFYRFANDWQLRHFPDWIMELVRSVKAHIGIYDSVNTKKLANIDSRKQALQEEAKGSYGKYIHDQLRWCTTLFPTQAYAQEAGMSLEEFREFVFEALLLNYENPLVEYERIRRSKENLAQKLSQVREVKIVGQKTSLSFLIEGRKICFNDDQFNLPAGEVWVAPLEKTTQGKIFFGVHSHIRSGREMRGIELNFEEGKVVSASAQVGGDYLQSLVSIDDGARYLGEFGIGSNFKLKRSIGHLLFDEKIGGTIHLALGHSFPSLTGGTNTSAIHEDFIFDLREEGDVFLDGRKLIVHEDRVDLE